MNKITSSLKGLFRYRLNVKIVSAIFIGFGMILALAPTISGVTKAESCAIYDYAVFNPFAVTNNPTPGQLTCDDLPTLSVKTGAYNYPTSVNANAGDTLDLHVYMHNGAATGSGKVIHNASYSITIDPNSNNATVYLSGTDDNGSSVTKTGSVSINIPSGASLKVMPGSSLSQNIGDLNPCFDFHQEFDVYVQVVGAVQPQGDGSIWAQQNGQSGNQCLVDATINWTAQNLSNIKVYVKDNSTGTKTLFAGPDNGTGNGDAPWLTPNRSYTFSLEADGGFYRDATFTAQDLSCNSTPTPTPIPQNPNETFTVTHVSGPDSQCMYNERLQWDTSNVEPVSVVVTADGQTTTVAAWESGDQTVGWVEGGKTYQFTLKAGNLQDIVRTVSEPGCNSTPTPNESFTVTHVSGPDSQCMYQENLNWTTSNVEPVEVWVNVNGQQSTKVAAWETGNQTVGWVEGGKTYNFSLKAGNLQDIVRTVSEPACNTTPTPTPAQQSGSIDFNYGGKVDGVCQVSGTVTWNTSNVGNVKVYVKDVTTGQQTLFGAYDNWTQTVGWFTPGEKYQFLLYGDGGFSRQTDVKTAPQVNCGSTPTPTPTPTPINPTPTPVSTYTATATANASAHAQVSCPNGTFASADASASAVATGTSIISQQDAQNNANQAASNMYNTLYAQAYAKAQAQAVCGSTPTPINPTPTPTPACYINNNSALNASNPFKQGSTYSVILTWSFTGSHSIKLTQINPGAVSESVVTASSQNNGTYTVNGLSAASSYIFKLYDNDSTCGGYLTSTSVNTPANPGQLTCTVGVSTIASGQQAIFSAAGGSAPYAWSGDGTPNVFNGSVYNPIYTNNTYNAITHNVILTSSDGQTANCGVVVSGQIIPTPTPTPIATPTPVVTTGNCNNSQNSCNNNTNTNNNTNSGTNSANQNNNSNINGNNNTVTQQNNNCVNNSCNNIVYISSGGTVVPANQFSQLAITKMVSVNGTGFQNSVSANNGQTVQFQIVVTNTGNAVANNVRLTDNLPYGLTYVGGSFNGGYNNYNNNNYSNNYYNNNQLSNINLGSLSAGQNVTVTFTATVNTNTGSIQNTATASSDNAGSVQASAWVFINPPVVYNPGCTVNCGSVQGASVNLSYSKKAFNESKNADATSVVASREDYITYTLTVSNNGNAPANSFVITDDLSQVLPYADVTDNGGGSVSGNVITFPGITVPAGGSVSRSFKVRIKYALASNLSYTMTNTYGNSISIRINTPQVLGAFTAPKTGADTMGVVFSTFLTLGAVAFKKRKNLLQLIFS